MGFATFATGYKGQAYDISSGFNLVRQNSGPTKAEKSRDWEIGMKSQLLDHRVTLNTTLFTTTFDNFQAQASRRWPTARATSAWRMSASCARAVSSSKVLCARRAISTSRAA